MIHTYIVYDKNTGDILSINQAYKTGMDLDNNDNQATLEVAKFNLTLDSTHRVDLGTLELVKRDQSLS